MSTIKAIGHKLTKHFKELPGIARNTIALIVIAGSLWLAYKLVSMVALWFISLIWHYGNLALHALFPNMSSDAKLLMVFVLFSFLLAALMVYFAVLMSKSEPRKPADN